LYAGGIPPSFKKEAAKNNVTIYDYADNISLPVNNSNHNCRRRNLRSDPPQVLTISTKAEAQN
jgi:hypothetical protein